MRYITKDKSRVPNFELWKITHQTILNSKLAATTKAGEVWDWFGENYPAEKSELRTALLKDQGHICCYCGQGLENIPTAIEHFHPKGVYINEIFDYDNLLISCKCSELPPPSIKFKVTPGYENLDTIEQISQKSGCSPRKIRKCNPILAGKHPNQIIAELSVGDDLFLHIQHCDDKKGGIDVKQSSNEIINPLTTLGCANLFFYSPDGNVSMRGVSHTVEKNVLDDVLCLNAPPLQVERAQAYNAAQMVRNRLVQELLQGNITELDLLEEINSQEKPDADDKFPSFCFVYTFVLSSLIN